MLILQNLNAKVKDKQILHNVALIIGEGEVAALMGHNGCGKSTLLNVIAGNSVYETSGTLELNGTDIGQMYPSERSKAGIFLAFQSPTEIQIKTLDYLVKLAKVATPGEFLMEYGSDIEALEIKPELLDRPFNDGFSGGERKKLEILQMLIIKPKLVLLDEIDTGVDVDNLITIAKVVNNYAKQNKASVLVVTHYNRFLKYVKPGTVYVMSDGEIKLKGPAKLAEQIDDEGYAAVLKSATPKKATKKQQQNKHDNENKCKDGELRTAQKLSGPLLLQQRRL